MEVRFICVGKSKEDYFAKACAEYKKMLSRFCRVCEFELPDAPLQNVKSAAEEAEDPVQRRVLGQLLYHLGRWIYLVDAADDLKKDASAHRYNPLIPRFGLSGDTLDPDSRREFVQTLDHSVHMIATAFELWDFGCWTAILESTIYTGLFQVGKMVLDGTFHSRKKQRENARIEENA